MKEGTCGVLYVASLAGLCFRTDDNLLVLTPPLLMNPNIDDWLKDCRDVEQLIQTTYEAADSPSALIVYVGQRTECVGDFYNLHWTPSVLFLAL